MYPVLFPLRAAAISARAAHTLRQSAASRRLNSSPPITVTRSGVTSGRTSRPDDCGPRARREPERRTSFGGRTGVGEAGVGGVVARALHIDPAARWLRN